MPADNSSLSPRSRELPSPTPLSKARPRFRLRLQIPEPGAPSGSLCLSHISPDDSPPSAQDQRQFSWTTFNPDTYTSPPQSPPRHTLLDPSQCLPTTASLPRNHQPLDKPKLTPSEIKTYYFSLAPPHRTSRSEIAARVSDLHISMGDRLNLNIFRLSFDLAFRQTVDILRCQLQDISMSSTRSDSDISFSTWTALNTALYYPTLITASTPQEAILHRFQSQHITAEQLEEYLQAHSQFSQMLGEELYKCHRHRVIELLQRDEASMDSIRRQTDRLVAEQKGTEKARTSPG